MIDGRAANYAASTCYLTTEREPTDETIDMVIALVNRRHDFKSSQSSLFHFEHFFNPNTVTR